MFKLKLNFCSSDSSKNIEMITWRKFYVSKSDIGLQSSIYEIANGHKI